MSSHQDAIMMSLLSSHTHLFKPSITYLPSSSTDLSSPRAPFVSWPLKRLCTEQTASNTTIPGLVFLCDNNSGGPGNIRNFILTCIRYAIEAGATGLQIPRIRTRSTSDKSDLFQAHEPFEYMFSESHFVNAMSDACPHIALFPAPGARGGLDIIPGVTAKSTRQNISPERLVRQIRPKDFGGSRAGCDERDPNRHTDRFGSTFRQWIAGLSVTLHAEPISWDNPMLVRLSWGVMWDWPVIRDGPEFAATFGGLLRIREDVLTLADGVVRSMKTLASSTAGADRRFLGVHLRTEEDALSQWPTYANQSEGYFRQADERGFRDGVAYLASGSETEARKFSRDARTHVNLDVKSKYDSLQGEELDRLKALSWDQQALVDFAVLLESDYFVGVSPSSFSINTALKRHLQKDGLYTRPWKIGSGDGRSWLVGQYSSYWNDWLFMFDGMWP
ncbi:hypothetical protein GGR50DRAFT_689605 [Xylaria sp. CBS 124048]|nr:hypothetical protein GGR50DRAFT_689605 [Xylaria sp. CBS 124048]